MKEPAHCESFGMKVQRVDVKGQTVSRFIPVHDEGAG